MKNIILLIFALFFCLQLNAQTSLEWVNVITAQMTNDNADVRGVEVDASGNVYMCGAFKGTYDFDPGPGTNLITGNAVWRDMFFQKYNSSGTLLWTKTLHGTSNNIPNQIELDAAGQVLAIGQFGNTLDFDPGPGVFSVTSAGDLDGFLLKLSTNGNFLWMKSIRSTENLLPIGFERDNSNNNIITGYSYGTADFDPGTGVTNHTSAGIGDIFVLKLNNNGDFVWVRNFGSTGHDLGWAVTVDASDNIYTLGDFVGTVNFNQGFGFVNLTTSPSSDIFIQKLNSNGVFQWVKQIGDGLPIFPYDIETRSNGLYVTGRYNTTIDFDPGAGVANLTPVGNYDAYLVKLNLNGDYQWAHSFGGIGFDSPYDIETPATGGVFLSGLFQNTVDFDPGTGTDIHTSNGSSEIFISKFDDLGNHQWVTTLGGADPEWVWDIAIGNSGYIHAGGQFWSEPMDFDPGAGTTLHSAGGIYDPFLLKLKECLTTTGTDTRNECAPFTWTNGVDYSLNNNSAMDTLVNAAGCDSIVTLDLTILPATAGVDTRTECGSYEWIDGNNYTSNDNTATFTIIGGASNGCDSIVTLDLTITAPSSTMTWD